MKIIKNIYKAKNMNYMFYKNKRFQSTRPSSGLYLSYNSHETF